VLWHHWPAWGWVTRSGRDPLGHRGREWRKGEGKGKGGKRVLLNRAPAWPRHGLHPCPGKQGWCLSPTHSQAQ